GGVAGLENANNTIAQDTGTAVHLGASPHARLRNNVLSVGQGIGVFVEDASELGLISDFNLFEMAAGGRVGYWQGDRSTLAAWQNAAFLDQNSLTGDPRFVDRENGDVHLQSVHGSFHGGSLAPIIDADTGLALMPEATLILDAATSPAIDRGDPTSPFANEPAPNGGFLNLGAYGNTAQASLSPEEYVLVTRPAGGESSPVEQTFGVRWRSHDMAGTV